MSTLAKPAAGRTAGRPKWSFARIRFDALLPIAVGIASGIAIWWLLSATETLRFLPLPSEVFDELIEAVGSDEFYSSMTATLERIVIAWLIAYPAAILIGVAMARNWVFEAMAHPYVFIGLAVPAPVTILFAVLAMGLGQATALVALCVVVTPFIVTFIYDGARAIDERYVEMGEVLRFSPWQQIRHVILPQLVPALLSGARFGFAMTWKIVVLVEALAASEGIGERLEYYFAFNNAAAILAWVSTFTVVMLIVEFGVFRTISARAFRWKRAVPSHAAEQRPLA